MELKQPSKAQKQAIDGLIDGSATLDSIHKSTKRVLLARGWVNEQGIVAQTGLQYTSHPTLPVTVVIFGKPVDYTHQYFASDADKAKNKISRRAVTFPKGTEMLITFAQKHKRYGAIYEGMINMNGEAIWVRIYRQPHMRVTERIMPNKKAIEDNANKSQDT